jgi:uncharacterized protein (TIGR00251 family)
MARETSEGVVLDILVQPRASKVRFGPVHGDRIKLSVTAAPVDGAANAAVVKTLAKIFGCPRSCVEITHGHTSRRKTVVLRGVALQTVQEHLDG